MVYAASFVLVYPYFYTKIRTNIEGMGDFLVICKFKSKKFEIIEKFKRAHVTFVPKM